MSWFGRRGPDPDGFWELRRDLSGTVRVLAGQAEAVLQFKASSNYLMDTFRFQRPDMTTAAPVSSRTRRSASCQEQTARGYPTGSFFCPPEGMTDCTLSEYPPEPGQGRTQDGSYLRFLCIPNGSARPDISVEVSVPERAWTSQRTPFDRGLVAYVNYIFGEQMEASVQTHPQGNYAATFRVHLLLDAPAASDRELEWRASATLRGVAGSSPEVPADARLELAALP